MGAAENRAKSAKMAADMKQRGEIRRTQRCSLCGKTVAVGKAYQNHVAANCKGK
jgi:hypothetical protein